MKAVSRQQKDGNTIESTEGDCLPLQKKLLSICIFNFLLLSLLGLLLRAWPFIHLPYLSYKNVLHAHSHFAFGGWVMPVLVLLILKFFPELCTRTNYRHWRKSIVLILVSSYGMLLSFPFQGYGAVSIVFSTLSIAAGFYAGFLVCSAGRQPSFLTSWTFLRTGFIYFFISSLGPFSTGPLIAMGKAGTTIYYNAIYFFLHFQYNGFFTFIVLAVLYKLIEANKPFHNGKLVFRLLNIACVPAYFLSVLWTHPSVIFYFAGGAAATLQLIAVLFFLKDIKGVDWKIDKPGWLFRIAVCSFILKNILQMLSAIPAIAGLAYQNRNFIIAYLHLVLIGFVSMFVLAIIIESTFFFRSRSMYRGVLFFLFAFISTELLLILQAAGYLNFLPLLFYLRLLFGLSIFFPVGLLLIYISVQRQNMKIALTR